MALNTNLSYQKLTHKPWLEDEEDDFRLRERVIGRVKSWPKVRKIHLKRRLTRVKIPSLKRFLRRKTKALVASWTKVIKRLKESQSHFGDLFAGNYLFLQVIPTPYKYGDKNLKGHDLSGVSYRCSVPQISL